MKEHDNAKITKDTISSSANIISTLSTKKNVDKLKGFIQVIIRYIKRAQTVNTSAKHFPVKAHFELMARMDFVSMYRSLSRSERKLFWQIVSNGEISKELGLSPKTEIFKFGYWGRYKGHFALFKGGKIIKLEKKGLSHDCTSKTPPPSGINKKLCNKKVYGTKITIKNWLYSMLRSKGKKDKLSPVAYGSSSMGAWKIGKDDLVAFEMRGYGNKFGSIPYKDWEDFIEDKFVKAATCRPGSKLTYGGSKKAPACP